MSFVSTAPNHQDVVLWRALGDQLTGRCVELLPAGASPLTGSLLSRGWWGRTVADVAMLPSLDLDLHVLSLHARDALEPALALTSPWVVVVTDPDGRTTAPSAEGWLHVLWDGVSDYLLRADHVELLAALDHAACIRDDFTTQERLETALWRERALDAWDERSTQAISGSSEAELAEMRASTSWRVTAPLRAIGGRVPSGLKG